MALLPFPPSGSVSVCSVQGMRHFVGTFIAGANLSAGMPVYIQTVGTQSHVFGCTTATALTGRCIGFTASSANLGETVSIVSECVFSYPQASFVMGSRVYMSTVAGQLDNVASGGFGAIGVFVPDNSVTQTGNTRALLWVKKLV